MDGTVKTEGFYKDNLRYGEQISYYPSGRIYSNGFYINDLRSGVWEFFTEEGVRDTLIDYK